MGKKRVSTRNILLIVLLCLVWLTQGIPALGAVYARFVYPCVGVVLSIFSGLVPFSLGDLFIFLSIAGLIVYPFYGRRKKVSWLSIGKRTGLYIVWIYVWFYLAWGLNYSQPNFYRRTHTEAVSFTPEAFRGFVHSYVDKLNQSYTPNLPGDKAQIHTMIVGQYERSGASLGIHTPRGTFPRVKTMLFTPLFSKMGVLGYMGPFFCEFNLNGDLRDTQYPATYAHELAHKLGIAREAEANFYAYQVCTRSADPCIRFSGYLSVFPHVMNNAAQLLGKEEYEQLLATVRPEVIRVYRENRAFWEAKYSPLIGDVQDWIYDLYLKGNKIESGRKNYSEVVRLLVSFEQNDSINR